jgi:mRNA interferase RelE/StbE
LTASAGWVFTARARCDFRRLDPPIQRRLTAALDRPTADPPQGDITRLAGTEDEWRLRVGDWRVRFITDAGTVYVLCRPRHKTY